MTAVRFGSLRVRADPALAVLSGLARAVPDAASDVQVALSREAAAPCWARPPAASTASITLWPESKWQAFREPVGDAALVLWRDHSAIRIDSSLSCVDCWIAPARSLGVLEHALQADILPRLSGQRQPLALHAGASVIDGRSVLYLGQSGAGKSTLVAAMHGAGHAPFGDDSGYLRHDPSGLLFAPFSNACRLLPDAFHALAGTDARRNSMRDVAGKIEFHMGNERNGTVPLPIGVIIELGRAGEGITHRRLEGHAALRSLLGSVMVLTPTVGEVIARCMPMLAQLATEVPVFALDVPRDLAKLPDVCRVVEEIARAH